VFNEPNAASHDVGFDFIITEAPDMKNWAHLPTDRHSGGCNLSFVDGHVRLHKWKALQENFGRTISEGGLVQSQPHDARIPAPVYRLRAKPPKSQLKSSRSPPLRIGVPPMRSLSRVSGSLRATDVLRCVRWFLDQELRRV
jgi:prepilin-type processing-associated H-X9-DG protein